MFLWISLRKNNQIMMREGFEEYLCLLFKILPSNLVVQFMSNTSYLPAVLIHFDMKPFVSCLLGLWKYKAWYLHVYMCDLPLTLLFVFCRHGICVWLYGQYSWSGTYLSIARASAETVGIELYSQSYVRVVPEYY